MVVVCNLGIESLFSVLEQGKYVVFYIELMGLKGDIVYEKVENLLYDVVQYVDEEDK